MFVLVWHEPIQDQYIDEDTSAIMALQIIFHRVEQSFLNDIVLE